MMAWRIFKKDMILLWPVALFAIVTQIGLAALMFAADSAPQSQPLMFAARLSVALVFLMIVFSIALDVQQEAIPGTRQDWLTRPIGRRDLLLAKLLFVLLAVHLPMLLCDLAQGLARGFPLGATTGAALVRNLNLFVTVSLPALGFAAMTANLAQFLIAGVAYLFITVAGTILLNLTAQFGGQEQATNPLFWTGVAWIAQTVQRAALAAGAVVVLALLYSRRKVAMARGLFPLFAVLSALAVLLPWNWIFAVQQAAAATPEVPVEAAFDSRAPRYRLSAGETPDAYGVGAAQVELRGRAAGDIGVETQSRRAKGDVTVFAPLRLSGVPAGALLWADRAVVRLKTPDGKLVFQGRGDDLKLDRASGGPVTRAWEAVRIPALVYEAVKDQPLTLEIDYSLSLLEPQAALSAAALGADVRVAHFGRCTTDRDEDGDEIALRCIKPGRAPSCVAATLDDPASGRRNPEALLCSPDYAPYVVKPFPDALSRFEVEAPFRDRLGVAAYPVGAGRLGTARIVVTPYKAVAHGQRRVEAQGLRLSAWTAG
jgi:hypothetical protein